MLRRSVVDVAGESVTVLRGGSGPRVLVLHDEWGISPDDEVWRLLGERFEIFAPIAPGFEDAPTSLGIRSVRDLALLYNRYLEELFDDPVAIIGISFGAWVALEMAVMCHDRITKLGLIGPVGLRFGAPDDRNFVDMFALEDRQLTDLLYLNPEAARSVSAESTDERLTAWARNREACASYGWEPYLYTPGLQRWTACLPTPVLILFGSDDRFVMDGYYERFASSFQESALLEIPISGHFPHLDSPKMTADAIARVFAQHSSSE